MFLANVKPSVFVSATTADLRTTREIVNRALNTLGCLPIEQSLFSTSSYVDVRVLLRKKIQTCQAVIHIAGLRYGREPNPETIPTSRQRRSYTQMEFDLARELKKPLYVFVCADDYSYDHPRSGIDSTEEDAELLELQRIHRQQLSASGCTYHRVATHEELTSRVRELETRLDELRRHIRFVQLAAIVLILAVIGLCVGLAVMIRGNNAVVIDNQNSLSIKQDESLGLLKLILEKQSNIDSSQLSVDRDPVVGNPEDNYLMQSLETGLSAETIKAVLAQYKESTDLTQQADVALVQRRFEDSERLYRQAAEQKLKQLDQATIAVAEDELGEGKSAVFQGDYVKAGEVLERAVRRIEDLPKGRETAYKLWADTQFYIGYNASSRCRISQSESERVSHALLAQAAYEKSLLYYNREAFPMNWAIRKNNLGIVLQSQAEIASGGERTRLLTEAIQSFRLALEVRTRETFPTDWARTQNNLGNLFSKQAEFATGSERKRLFNEAIQAYQMALTILSRETLPSDWANTQNHLGFVYRNLGEDATRSEQTRLFDAASQAYQRALDVRTRETIPTDWAQTQHDLGMLFSAQAEVATGSEQSRLLDAAYQSYQRALEVRTRELLPSDWAWTQNNLGIVLRYQANLATDTEKSQLFADAFQAFQNALEIHTRDNFPIAWAKTQRNLGRLYYDQGKSAKGQDRDPLLEQARNAYQHALEIYTREDFPTDWAKTQQNLGYLLYFQARLASGPQQAQLFVDAVQAFQQAIQIYTREDFPTAWARTQRTLGIVLDRQSRLDTGPDQSRLMAEAVHAYQRALEVYAREEFPIQWSATRSELARTQRRLGQVLEDQVKTVTEPDQTRLITEAIQEYHQSLEVYTREDFPSEWATTRIDLARTQQTLAKLLSDQAKAVAGPDQTRLIAGAIQAYQDSLQIYTRENFPKEWAQTQSDLGILFHIQAKSADGQERARLLDEAVQAFQNALEIATRESYPAAWATIQTNMSAVFVDQIELARASERSLLVDKAIQACKHALEFFTRETSPKNWAQLQHNLGLLFHYQAKFATDDEQTVLFFAAVQAYRHALEIRTQESFPHDWAITQQNLGIVFFDQGRLATGAQQTQLYGEAANCYEALLRYQPDQTVFNSCVSLYAEELGDFEKVHQLLSDWLKDHPEDIRNQMNLLENHLVTERFKDCLTQSDILRQSLARPEYARYEAVRQVLEAMTFLVLNEPGDSRQRIQELSVFLERQSPEFKLGWSWKGMKRFLEVSQNEQVMSKRERLQSILDAVSQPDQPSIMAKVTKLTE
jgi:tetratricopeptide (TPR) repeat protein